MKTLSAGRASGGVCFAELLDRLAAELRLEHQREVHALRAEIERLESKLAPEEALSCPEREPGARGAPAGVREGCAAAASGQGRQQGGEAQPRQPQQQLPVKLSRWGQAVTNVSTALAAFHASPAPKRPAIGTTVTLQLDQGLSIGDKLIRKSADGSALAFIENLISNSYFEMSMCILIATNAVLIGLELQYISFRAGAGLGYSHDYASRADRWRGVEDLVEVTQWIFGIAFTIEIVLRVLGERIKFVFSIWSWLDLCVVVIWIVSAFGIGVPINPQFVRIARFARLIRLLRLVRRVQTFDALFLMTTALNGSITILAWTCCLLFLILTLSGMMLNALLTEFYFQDASFPLAERLEIFRYFGTVEKSIFSMFEVTLGNWPPISRALYENVSDWFVPISLLHKLTIGFAIIGVINGVFIQETFKVAQQDDEIMLRRQRNASRLHAKKMRQLVVTADDSGEGVLDKEEFRKMFKDPDLVAWFASMEFSPKDVDTLFKMMDDGDGTLTVDELIKGVASYKGTARNIDLNQLMYEQKQLVRDFRRFQGVIEKHLLPQKVTAVNGRMADLNEIRVAVDAGAKVRAAVDEGAKAGVAAGGSDGPAGRSRRQPSKPEGQRHRGEAHGPIEVRDRNERNEMLRETE